MDLYHLYYIITKIYFKLYGCLTCNRYLSRILLLLIETNCYDNFSNKKKIYKIKISG